MQQVAEDVIRADDFAFTDRIWADWSPGYNASEDLPKVKDCIRQPEHFQAALGHQPETSRDTRDVRRMAHNPEVAGSNPSPATKFACQRPLPIMGGAFCVCRVHRIVHEASEEGRRGGWALRRTPGTSFATQAADGLPPRRGMNVCDRLQMKCNPPTIDP